MKAVTVRQMPPAVARAVERRARSLRVSVNRAVISLLEDAAGVGKRAPERARHHDLDALAGVWSRAEADEFDRSLKAQRAIDADVWR